MATTSNDSASVAAAANSSAKDGSGVAPATSFSPSGAAEQIVPDVDPSHPAVDNDPRANTSVLDNKIIFNDPTKSGAEAVADLMAGQKLGAEPTEPKAKA